MVGRRARPAVPGRRMRRRSGGWPARWRAVLQTLHRVPSEGALESWLDRLTAPARSQVLAFANAHAFNLAARDAQFCHDLLAADTVVRDGVGVAWLMRLQRLAPGLNLNGTDLIPRVLARYPGRRILLLGTCEPWLSQARARVLELAPGAQCEALNGFESVSTYLAQAQAQQPALVLLAMGMPRQEAVAQALRRALPAPALLVCGGAILDFLGGRHPRAPVLLRRLGLEWAWRLGREPLRLWHRYVLGNPLFVARALRLAWRRDQSSALSRRARG